MVKHIVIFKFNGTPDEKQEVCKNFAEALMQLPDDIPQLKSIETGINMNPEEDWDFVLTACADTLDDIKIYAEHPAHLEAVKIIAPYKKDRACVDYII